MKKGFMYLFAIIDVYSRYVISWSISNTMTLEWCVSVLKDAFYNYGTPEIINSDQGTIEPHQSRQRRPLEQVSNLAN